MTLILEIMFVIVFIPKLTNVDPIFNLSDNFLWPMVTLYILTIYMGDHIHFKCIRLMIKDLKTNAFELMGQFSHSDLNKLDKAKVTHYLEHETNIIAKGVIRSQDLVIDIFLVLAHIVIISSFSFKYIALTIGVTSIIIAAGFFIRPILKKDLVLLSKKSASASNQLIFNVNSADRIQHEGMWASRTDQLKNELEEKLKLELSSHAVRLRLTVVFYSLAIFYIIMMTNLVGSQGFSVLGLSALTIFIRLGPRLLNVQKHLNSWHIAVNLYDEMEGYFNHFPTREEAPELQKVLRIDFKDFNIQVEDKLLFKRTLNFTLDGPGFYGIIGESGSGKSLIADCLAGFKLTNEGEILFNQKPTQQSLDIYLISSHTPIYPVTLLENIRLESAYDVQKYERILETCDLVELSRVQGLNFINQTQLSLGEKQRIVMARAMYRSSSCLILDESLSSLDFLREKKILKFLKEHSLKNMVIHITHHLDSVREAKSIFLLEEGRVLNGTWSELALDPECLISKYDQRNK